MRLLRRRSDNTLAFIEASDDKPPPYAILSHTWLNAEEEVKYEDIEQDCARRKDGYTGPAFFTRKAGYTKIEFCLAQAEKHGLKYAWLDTACIDKRSSAQLNKAINWMFRYYSQASQCFVFLSDVLKEKSRADAEDISLQWHVSFRTCRWFTRGWTLQELLAPTSIKFFDRNGELLGTKHELSGLIEEITTVPTSVLRGDVPLESIALQTRFDWSVERSTTEPEDRIYCLYGILGVSFPANYGEGYKIALRRLRRELGEEYRNQPLTLDFGQRGTSQDRIRNIVSVQTIGEAQTPRKPEWLEDLQQSLDFDQSDARKSNIQPETAQTCEWLLTHPTYTAWKDDSVHEQHKGLLWIKGKPGAGKSTLMKYADVHTSETMSDHGIVISFYFHARGSQLEHSVEGMYRALLCQLINKLDCSKLVQLASALEPYSRARTDSSWSIGHLQMLFSILVASLQDRQLIIFIDALDESDEDDVRQMIHFFEDLSQTAMDHHRQMLVCLASRHYPAITISTAASLDLDSECGHHEDLERHVAKTLRIGSDATAVAVYRSLVSRANGVFIWAVIVIRMLNQDFARGCIHNMAQRLEQIPQDMSKLFQQVIRQDDMRMDEFVLCLQLLLFSTRTLKRAEFYNAMMVRTANNGVPRLAIDPLSATPEDMTRYVLSTSKGLAEVVVTTTHTSELEAMGKKTRHSHEVQFVHETVQDYLLKGGGLRDLLQTTECVESISHDRLKVLCENQLLVSSMVTPESAHKDQDAWYRLKSDIIAEHPFYVYARDNVIYHADQAACDVTQRGFLKRLNAQRHLTLWNITESIVSETMLHYLARRNAARLIRETIHTGETVDLKTYCGQTPLHVAVSHGAIEAAEELICQGADVNGKDAFGNTALIEAVKFDVTLLMELLLAAGADIEARGRWYSTALDSAFRLRHDSAIKLLIDNGANVVSACYQSYTADWLEPTLDETRLTQIADLGKLDERDADGRTLLHIVSRLPQDDRDIPSYIDWLLEHGANIDALDYAGNTALSEALRRTNLTAAGPLLARGATAPVNDHEIGALITAIHDRLPASMVYELRRQPLRQDESTELYCDVESLL